MQEIQTTLPNGTIVHTRYVVEDMLGKGGFGAVYLVRDRRVENNRFALKEIIEPDARTLKNFTLECELLRRLDHPALPRFYSLFDDDNHTRIYLLMDYVAGQNLDILRQRQHKKRFSIKQAMRLMEPIMDAISYLHQCEPPIIHRDIKPANIIVSASRDDTVLVDFGIAKEYNQDATTTAVRRLSPHYSAPEQYTFGTNLRTDIYGLAATFYALLAGTVPIDAFHRVVQLRTKGVDPLEPLAHLLPHLAPAVSDVIERALAIRAEDRYASVQEFQQALRDAVADVTPDNSPASLALLAPELEREQQVSEPLSSLPAVDDIAERDTTPATTAMMEVHNDVPVETTVQDNSPVTSPAVMPSEMMIQNSLVLMPAVARSMETPIPAVPDEFTPTRRPVARRLMVVLLCLLLLFALVAGLLYSTGRLQLPGVAFIGSGARQSASSTRTAPVSTPTAHATAVVTPTAGADSSPTSIAHQNPTSPVAPFVTGSTYAGTAHNQSANIDGDITFTNVKQQGSNFMGTVTFTNGLTGQANFTGTMHADRSFTFIVTPYSNELPLLFQGNVNTDNTLSGKYCSERNNVCDYSAGGYGSWQMTPK